MKQESNQKFKWSVLAAACFVTTFVFGLLFSFGSLLNAMLDTFHESRSRTATVQAILVGVGLSTGAVSGVLIARLGIWKMALLGALLAPLGLILAFLAKSIVHLYITIGGITGLGISLLFISSATAASQSFTGTKRLLALAIQNSGISLAGIILPYCLNFLVSIYGLNGAFLILGGVYLNCLPVAIIYAILEQAKKLAARREVKMGQAVIETVVQERQFVDSNCQFQKPLKRELKSFKAFYSTAYILTFFAVSFTIASLNGYMSLVLDILTWKDFEQSEALLAFPVTYGVGLGARLLPGVVKQRKGVNSLVLPIAFTVCGFAGQAVIFAFTNQYIVMLGCGLSGIAVSGVVSAATILVVQIVPQQNIAIGLGLINTGIGVSSAVSGPSFGAIRDSSESYALVLQLTMGFQLIGALLFIAVLIVRKRGKSVNLKTKQLETHAISIIANGSKYNNINVNNTIITKL